MRRAQDGEAQPPRAKAKAKTEQGLPKALGNVTMELREGERDGANIAFLEQVLAAWEVVQGHQIFEAIQQKAPTTVTSGGTQRPFSQHDLDSILKGATDNNMAYVSVGNLAWIGFAWTATPPPLMASQCA